MLIVRLAKNHPLPDGNKRAAWVALRVFIELNQWSWSSYPPVDEAERAVVAIAGVSGTRRGWHPGFEIIWKVRTGPSLERETQVSPHSGCLG